jgi:hypothetical protein
VPTCSKPGSKRKLLCAGNALHQHRYMTRNALQLNVAIVLSRPDYSWAGLPCFHLQTKNLLSCDGTESVPMMFTTDAINRNQFGKWWRETAGTPWFLAALAERAGTGCERGLAIVRSAIPRKSPIKDDGARTPMSTLPAHSPPV